jgi:hypothetical protein
MPDNCYWWPHQQGSEVYDLSHLHPFYLTIASPAKEDKPEIKYECIVQFAIHCFTSDPCKSKPEDHHYSDSRETRLFCVDRYLLSYQLPDIVKGIKKGLNTKTGKFIVIKVRDHDGVEINYKLAFTMSRSSKEKGKLNFFINSAYRLTTGSLEKNKKPMALHIIAYKTLHRKPY